MGDYGLLIYILGTSKFRSIFNPTTTMSTFGWFPTNLNLIVHVSGTTAQRGHTSFSTNWT